uniref:Uncharacterized protein n=1 Tax=Candidatus Kentrum sp. TC TaxID=2126339 RepID=A0A450Y793_9GAMM|nr:MAG: hypothetical protein BECKTC1821D_GA0114238_100156 [Candidatus Kentron sp. TC]VFK37702.1 MAG: hypothetical protein BECKTC1821E_GA0114239_100165 [Candidatus Kentron sp. TC]VFK51496.1 MAG: hypothetical protein BECKTC1821F_GA0114240_1001114 [Candidatus Kentron sp. TC]
MGIDLAKQSFQPHGDKRVLPRAFPACEYGLPVPGRAARSWITQIISPISFTSIPCRISRAAPSFVMDRYDEELIRRYLLALTPDNVLVMVSNPETEEAERRSRGVLRMVVGREPGSGRGGSWFWRNTQGQVLTKRPREKRWRENRILCGPNKRTDLVAHHLCQGKERKHLSTILGAWKKELVDGYE